MKTTWDLTRPTLRQAWLDSFAHAWQQHNMWDWNHPEATEAHRLQALKTFNDQALANFAERRFGNKSPRNRSRIIERLGFNRVPTWDELEPTLMGRDAAHDDRWLDFGTEYNRWTYG